MKNIFSAEIKIKYSQKICRITNKKCFSLKNLLGANNTIYWRNTSLWAKKNFVFLEKNVAGRQKTLFFSKKKLLDGKNKVFFRPADFLTQKTLFNGAQQIFDEKTLFLWNSKFFSEKINISTDLKGLISSKKIF